MFSSQFCVSVFNPFYCRIGRSKIPFYVDKQWVIQIYPIGYNLQEIECKKRKQRNKYFHKCVRLFHTIYNIIIIKNVLFVNITKTYYKGTEKSIYINGGGGGVVRVFRRVSIGRRYISILPDLQSSQKQYQQEEINTHQSPLSVQISNIYLPPFVQLSAYKKI